MKKPSFLERLTGSVPAKDYDRILDEEHTFGDDENEDASTFQTEDEWNNDETQESAPQEGELPVDMYQTNEAIIIKL